LFCFCTRGNALLEIFISEPLCRNVFEESYLVITESHAIDQLSLGDRPVDRDRLVGHPWRRPCIVSNISIVAISVGLPAAVNPVPASQVGFQQFRAI